MLERAIKYLLDNPYAIFCSMCLRQLIGIPMGSDPAPFMANLFFNTAMKGSSFFRQKTRRDMRS